VADRIVLLPHTPDTHNLILGPVKMLFYMADVIKVRTLRRETFLDYMV
jgi:hypothetical protein